MSLLPSLARNARRCEAAARPCLVLAPRLRLVCLQRNITLPDEQHRGVGNNSSDRSHSPFTSPTDTPLPSSIRVTVSAKTNASSLVQALTPLLARTPHEDSDISSFGSQKWFLDPSGTAIHRYLAPRTSQATEDIIEAINAAANEMNHHPHIARSSPTATSEAGRIGAGTLAVTCSTHKPRGLSMRDIRLARKIDEIAAGYDVQTSEGDFEGRLEEVTTARATLIAQNRKALGLEDP